MAPPKLRSRIGLRPLSCLPPEFWLYFTGQTISNLGSAFAAVAVPLLVYRLTDSATELGATTAVTYLPWVLFGLLGGAVLDRVDRKRAMVISDVARGATICAIPALAAVGDLRLVWIYAVMFVQGCMQVIFASGEFTAVAALVDNEQLVRANALIQASYSGATVVGSGLAGLMFAVLPISDALYVDGVSFLASALSLLAVRRSFNAQPPGGLNLTSMRAVCKALAADTKAGLGYVWRDPILRSLSLQLMIVNLFGSAATAELALFATKRLGADNSHVGYLYAASSLGVVAFSLVVGPLNRRLRFATVIALGLCLYGGGTAVFGLLSTYSVALGVMGIVGGATVLYNASSAALRQRTVPDELMGRVWSIALTGAWCMIPVGSLGAGAVISATHEVRAVYVVVAVVIVAAAVGFNRLWLRAASTGKEAPEPEHQRA